MWTQLLRATLQPPTAGFCLLSVGPNAVWLCDSWAGTCPSTAPRQMPRIWGTRGRLGGRRRRQVFLAGFLPCSHLWSVPRVCRLPVLPTLPHRPRSALLQVRAASSELSLLPLVLHPAILGSYSLGTSVFPAGSFRLPTLCHQSPTFGPSF